MKTALMLGGLALAAAPACAQNETGAPLDRGRTYAVESRVLGESRTVDVSLPKGYERNAGRRYPVLYVLDGDYEQEIAAAVAGFHGEAGTVPPMIVVGVRTPNRTHDLTTVAEPGFDLPPEARDAGGAGKFLAFLAGELVPWVNHAFRTDSMRVLVGHSLGGLFAAYAIAQRPTLFTGWVLMEPSLWWNRGAERSAMLAALRAPADRHARVMAVNMEPLALDTSRWGDDKPMVRELAVTGETHSSMAAIGLAMSLRTMFADFLPGEWRPGTRPIAMLEHYDSLADRLGFAVPIPEAAFTTVARMSIDSPYYDDAARVIDRMEATLGASPSSRAMRDKLASDRTHERPGFVPLVFPSHRPSPREAERFLGRWVAVTDSTRVLDVRASGDTIVLHDREALPSGMPWEGDRPVVQVTTDGSLEWGLPVFRGLAALLVQRGRIQPNGTLLVTPEVRGWVPVGPGPDLERTVTFRRVPS